MAWGVRHVGDRSWSAPWPLGPIASCGYCSRARWGRRRLVPWHGRGEIFAPAIPEALPQDPRRLLYVEVVLYGVISDVHVVGRDKVLQGVMVHVVDANGSCVYV